MYHYHYPYHYCSAVTEEALNTFGSFPCQEINSLQGGASMLLTFPPATTFPELISKAEKKCRLVLDALRSD